MRSRRFDALDALRGVAIVCMTLFHVGFDLNHFGYWKQDFLRDPRWTLQRTAIVGLFVFCAGLGQAVAVHQGQGWPRFWRRWGQVAACALLVTAGSYWMFPRSFIYFGVLHAIAVMLIIGRLTSGWGRGLWLAGAVAVALPVLAAAGHRAAVLPELLNQPGFNVLGLIGRLPRTEDYVPLFPWLGVMWWGVAAGQTVLRQAPAWLARPMPPATAPLSWLGRWSLSWYMLHQPVLIGAFTLAT